MNNEIPEPVQVDTEEKWYVDIPDHLHIGVDESFINIGEFKSKSEAIDWMRENIDEMITDDGYLRILTH